MAGRKKETSDVEILRQFALSPDPVMSAIELTDNLNMSRQGIFNRLEELQEGGYLNSKKPSRDRVWWLTPKGRKKISEAEN